MLIRNRQDATVVEHFRENEVQTKAMASLLGICQGLIADQKIVEQELSYLRHWILENERVLEEWPGTLIFRKIQEIINDGVITEEELENFKQVLEGITGARFHETGVTQGLPTDLPVNKEATIIIPDKLFCFTGKFVYGPRNRCQEATTARGGRIHDGVISALDYLVIGTLVSEAWVNTSYGRKIQKAVAQQQKGLHTMVVSEEMWVASLS